MWIENILNQININNVNRLDEKKGEITQQCFINLLNTIIQGNRVCINEGSEELKDFPDEEGVENQNLRSKYDILLNLLNILQIVSKNENRGIFFETLEPFFIDSKVFDGLLDLDLKKKEISIAIERLLSKSPNIGFYITNILFSEKGILRENSSDNEPFEKNIQKFSFLKENSDIETKINVESSGKLSSENPIGTIIIKNKELNSSQHVVSELGQYIDNAFENMNVESSVKLSRENPIGNFINKNKEVSTSQHGISEFGQSIDNPFENVIKSNNIFKEVNFNKQENNISNYESFLNENIIDIDGSKLSIQIQTTERKGKENDNTNLDNHFHLVTKHIYSDNGKNENNNLEFIESVVDIKRIEDIKNVFKEQILIKRESENTIVLIMEPKDIGKVKVTLTINDGVIKAEVYPNTDTARNFFKENIDRIMASLGSEGINLGQFVLRDDRGNRSNEKDIEKGSRFHSVDPIIESNQEIKRSSNLNGLSIYA